jgi:predicted kinase
VSQQFLLQMAGEPGSGKSALARVIARRTGGVVLDKDVLKTAALHAGADDTLAGQIAYEAFFDLADHLLGQGLSVVLDSPSFFEAIPAKGQAIADKRGVRYHFVECICDDQAELERRLAQRPRLDSQPSVPEGDSRTTAVPVGAYLRVDTLQPIERCLELVLEYVA